MCANDLIAVGILLEFARHDIRVPDDVSVVGFDDLAWAAAVSVPLTTVRQPRADLGKHAVRMLLDEIDRSDAHAHRNLLLPPNSSCAHPRHHRPGAERPADAARRRGPRPTEGTNRWPPPGSPHSSATNSSPSRRGWATRRRIS
ncbi:substrate-binding domain-containing protein [Microbacterium elymi]|uniref:Substrate-binding domain-containing protein n=1 Tax=Microbacterium elymi TaxID=2909587 RepID=A0ABY5NIT0_9MICO|nr:substrate-binding domain-containing protein [Microbacterium elymi]UUT35046.1 substrate-binding domain-containing protein [Microbacterium elymi]